MATTKITWTGAKGAIEAASERLTETLWPPAGAVSLSDETGAWKLEAYFEETPAPGALADALAETGLGAGAFETLPDIDWVAHALAGLGIVRAGRFLLYGVHDADKLPDEPDVIAIRIDANQAFGTGHHPTTAGCLTLLDRLAGIAPHKILDLGTGSAVLAIAAAKLWKRSVLAADIDDKSVEIARENASLNDVAQSVDVVKSDGFSNPRIEDAAPFDFVFANILAGPLIDLAPEMAAHVDVNGRVILAGLMAEQEEDVAAAYQSVGFRRINRLAHETWPVLLFVRL